MDHEPDPPNNFWSLNLSEANRKLQEINHQYIKKIVVNYAEGALREVAKAVRTSSDEVRVTEPNIISYRTIGECGYYATLGTANDSDWLAASVSGSGTAASVALDSSNKMVEINFLPSSWETHDYVLTVDVPYQATVEGNQVYYITAGGVRIGSLGLGFNQVMSYGYLEFILDDLE